MKKDKSAGIDVTRIVWSDAYDPLVVGPSADCPGYVNLTTMDQEGADFWGPVNLTLPKDMALKLAEAIKACAEEQQEDA